MDWKLIYFLFVVHIGLSAQNLASGKPVYVSSTESSLYVGNNAVDGNITTRWSSDFIEPSWIYIDLEELLQINKVILHWEAAYAQKYTIEVSTDSNTWTTVYSEQNSNGQIDQINFELVTTRYVRMWGITRVTEYGFSLFEFEIYGPETQLSSDASLSSIYIGNEILSYFKASNYSYNYSLFPSQTDPPQISAIASSTSATIYIEQAQSLSSPATITVVSADGSSTKVYDVNFYKPEFNQLVWSDEFNNNGNVYNSAVNALDNFKWHHQIHPPNGHSWFNGEHQHYTNRIENSFVSDGTLKIKSKKENYTHNGSTKAYTSARLNSKFSFLYGRVDISAKLPQQEGTWPALWTLGDNINEYGNYFGDTYGDVGWPACGEIDIMEQKGDAKSQLIGHLHWGDTQSGDYQNTGNTIHVGNVSSSFNIYSLEWTKDYIAIFFNNTPFLEIANSRGMPYDNPHFLLLNIAMGGDLGGSIPEDFDEAIMEIDYIRVFQEGFTASIQEAPNKAKISMFPNPATNSITIQSATQLKSIQIFDLSGRSLMSFDPMNQLSYDIKLNLVSGAYFAKIVSNSGSSFKRLTIK